ncbi:MAG: hypothetical protein LQ338_003398 [Usnochroma carphineum]|nr:MAG: hypothetical protein LQ338_003398 [Usnochroma carphineum]
MASHLDPAQSISMDPHPLVQPEESSNQAPAASSWNRRAISTSYELDENPQPGNDPHARHPIAHSHSSSSSDVENTFHHNSKTDPYQLSSKLKSPSELNLIRANTSRKRDGFGPITTNKAATKAKKVHDFYEAQNENIERWLRPVDEHIRLAKKFDGENHLKFKIAVQGSFAANLILAALQIFAAVYSGSLSLFTTMADAIFDPMSNITLIVCNRAVKKVDPRRFPSGKARIETAGNIVFCFLMTAVSFILIVLSAMELAEGNPAPRNCVPLPENNNCAPLKTKPFHLASIIVVTIAFCTKLCLFCYCWALKDVYSQIHILWEDHRNDMFINGVGILTSVGGSYLRWWIDPVGAILLSCLIATLWLRTAYKEFQLLIGVTADTQLQQWITYISMTHSPQILSLDTVRAYHSGPRIIVEVDVVMDPDETLRATHDVAEDLQVKLESLPDVERAYVHIDFETSHKPEHFLKKEL